MTGGALLAQLIARLLGSEFFYTGRQAGGPAGHHARYTLPPGASHRVLGKRMALVDDVISAGSSLRATLTEVETHGAIPVVVGALHVLGTTGAGFFAERGLRIETTGRGPFDLYRAAECPLCAAGVPLEDPADLES
jgi:orotate phosphoribosyltransferase